jgi:ankyrin repeat protein
MSTDKFRNLINSFDIDLDEYFTNGPSMDDIDVLQMNLEHKNIIDALINKIFVLALDYQDDDIDKIISDNKWIVDCLNKDGTTIIHLFTFCGFGEGYEIIKKYNGNLNILDSYGNSCFHYAILDNKNRCIDKLCELGANPNVQDSTGNTPLHIAIMNNSNIDVLIMHGADPNIKNDNGNTPLDYAIFDKNIYMALANYMK